jgi:2-aminoadipate transaminase
VVDDDPYGALRFSGVDEPPLTATSLVRIGTVSKVLAPGLRVGWIVGPPSVVDACVRLKQAADLHSSTLSQHVVATLLRDESWFAGHLSFIRELYRARAETLLAALREHFGDRIEIAPVRGGLFAWITFTDGTDTDELLAHAIGHRVAFVPGSSFSAEPRHRHAARLCFASLPTSALADAVGRLAAAHQSVERSHEVDDAHHEPEHDHERSQLLRR